MNRKIYSTKPTYENRFINETITIDEHHYHPSAPMTRILHKESDILPISHSNYTGLMSSHTPYSHITPSEYKITKRHLALVSNKNDDFRVVDQYSSDHYQQPIHSAPIFLNRKVATSSSRPLEIHDLNEVTTNKRVKKAQSQDRFNATPTSHHVSKTSMKSIGATTVTTMTTTSTATSKHHNIISTSSWRVGEALVQKQLGDYLSDIKAPISSNRHEQHQHPRSAIAMNSASYSKETKKQTSKSAPKTVKRTECHLVDDAASTTRLRTAASKENLAESSKKSKSKPYDIEDIRRYMEQQKIKRLQEKKSDQEREKAEAIERRKKRQEEQKQRAEQQYAPTRPMVKRESSSTRENMNKVITVAKKESDDDEDEEEESKDDEDEDKKETSTKDYIKRKVEMLMEEDARMKAATAAAKNKPTTKRVGFDRKQTGRPSRQKDVSIKKNDDDDDDDESESNSSTRTFDHHERLRQICSFALDLQTKIEQTKLVLERIGNETNPAPAQLNEPLRQSRRSPRVRRRTDSSPKATTPVLLLPLPLSLSPRKSASFSVSQSIDSTTTLPGVKVYKTDTVAMTRDLAARRIQSAYRLYLSRRPDHSRRKPPARPNPNYSIANRKTTRPVPKIPQPKIDEYNFINVFHKKRGTVFSSPRKDSPNRKIKKSSSSNIAKTGSMSESKHHRSTHNQPNYTEDFVTNRTGSLRGNENEKSGGGQSRLAEETDEHSSIKSNLEVSSTSSSSTSLSKYVNKSPVSRKSDPRASTATLTGEIDERPEIEINERMGSSRAARSDVTTSQSSRRSSEEEEERQVAPSHRGNVMHEIEPSSTSSPSFSSSSEVRKLKTATKVARTLRVMAEPSSNRYSPSSLERLLNINMNYLDTLNVSAVQIEELDKVRCVGRAQQETVALAYMLKSKQEAIAHDNAQKHTSNEAIKTNNEVKSRTTTTTTRAASPASSSTVSSSSSSSSSSVSSSSSRSTRTSSSIKTKTMSDDEESTSIKTESQVKSGKMALVRSGGGDESTDEVETASEMRTTDVLSDDMSRSRSKATSDTKGGGGKSTRRLSFENDSFKKFTSDMIDKYMQEEAMRSRHQAHLLKLRERALVEKTNAELAWIEQMKKKALDKGQDDRMPSMLAKEKGIMSKLKREQANIDRLKAAQRKEAQNRLGVLTQHAEVIKWCQDKLKKIRAARKDGGGGDVESDEIKSEIDNSVEDEDNEDDDTNRSLIEDKVLKQVKKQLESEKYLTEREKKLRARRKQAEELIEWKKKLDEEELRVREIERRAKAVLASKPTPATIPTTSNTLTAGKSKKQTAAASITSESEATTPRPAARVNTKLDEKITNDEDNSYIETFISAPSTSRIHTQIENGNSSNRQQKSTTTNTNLVSESIQTQFEKDSSHSIQENIITATETNKTSSSSSATSSSSSMSEIVTTTSAHSAKDLEFKVRELKNQLLKKKSEAEQLKKSLKAKEKTKLKEKENDLRKKIESYDVMIDKMKTQLDRDETSETTSQTPPVMRRATAQPQPSTHHTAPNVVTQPQTQVATAAKKQNANVTPAPRKTVVHEENESPRRRAFKSLNDDDIKTDTINDQLDELSSAPSTSRQQSEHMMVFKAPTENEKVTETATTTKQVTKPASPSPSPSPYDDDFLTSEKQIETTSSIAKNTRGRNQSSSSHTTTSSRSSSSSSSTSSTVNSSSTSTNRKSRRKQGEYEVNKETETGQGVVDDDKSTVSEISEEIMGESSVAEQRKSLKLNLNDDEAGDNDDEPTTSSSSSSTDTQILLLSSRNKKVDEELSQEVNVPLTPSNPAPVLDDKTKSREILAAKLEKSLLDKFIDDAIEIHEKKTSKMLTDQYKQAVVFGLDQDERDTDEDEDDDDDVNNLDSSPNPFKIHIPSIDLSEDDDDELIKTGVKAPPKPPPIVYNVPINNEKVSNLTGSLVDNYFWPRLDNLKEHLIRLDDEEIQNLPELVDFFKSDLENPNNDAKEAEATFKRMLFDMVGELLYDLYLEKYELPQAISSYLPNAKRSLKKAYFRSALRGPLQKETAKKMIINKVLDLLLKTSLDERMTTRRNEVTSSRSKWRMQKKLDLVDSLLDREMREQDYEWANYEVEEQESRVLLADTIFDMILKDTVDCFQISYMKKNA